MCSGEQEAAERAGKIKIKISQRAEIPQRRPWASAKLVHICSTSGLPNTPLLWEGPSRPQQDSRGAFLLKKVFSVSIHVCSCLLDGDHIVSQHSLGKKLSPKSSWLSEKQSQCFPHYFLLLQASPPLWLLFDLLSTLALGEEGRSSVCAGGERWWVSATLWLVYIHQKGINST